MNPLLLNLLMTRLGSGSGTGSAAIARLMTPGESAVDAESLLTGMAADHPNPMVRDYLHQVLEQRRAARSSMTSVDAPSNSNIVAGRSLTPADVQPLVDREADAAELQRLREQLGDLAHALGACPACWGKDPKCGCRGRGAPGYAKPDVRLFTDLVLPAIRHLRALESSERKASVPTPGPVTNGVH